MTHGVLQSSIVAPHVSEGTNLGNFTPGFHVLISIRAGSAQTHDPQDACHHIRVNLHCDEIIPRTCLLFVRLPARRACRGSNRDPDRSGPRPPGMAYPSLSTEKRSTHQSVQFAPL